MRAMTSNDDDLSPPQLLPPPHRLPWTLPPPPPLAATTAIQCPAPCLGDSCYNPHDHCHPTTVTLTIPPVPTNNAPAFAILVWNVILSVSSATTGSPPYEPNKIDAIASFFHSMSCSTRHVGSGVEEGNERNPTNDDIINDRRDDELLHDTIMPGVSQGKVIVDDVIAKSGGWMNPCSFGNVTADKEASSNA